ncbi:hypothetical protein HID58_034663 [Brassica napus]|uniref:Uncharacterized protein n=1 Tax=Brassica napus TaxID=3708 RepID=A0ABQ8C2P1_BRANA|nr:hypothetical protein HID58_034663 [Brassica napus]
MIILKLEQGFLQLLTPQTFKSIYKPNGFGSSVASRRRERYQIRISLLTKKSRSEEVVASAADSEIITGFYIGKTSEKLHPIENPEDIIVQSAGLMMHTLFSEPMLLILTDPRTDHPGNSIFELMSFFPYTTDSFVLTWILCVPVCCRPLRKENILNQLTKVVQLVKLEKDPCAAFCFDHRSQITLDDANDVGMIQEADTAVCISGFQIMQFMTAQFRFLERLLMFMETEAINE